MPVFHTIENTIAALDVATIPRERKETLQPFIEFIQKKQQTKQEIRLNFICTHNSRRSHLSQVWAQTMAYHCNIQNVFCYSGGTEPIATIVGLIPPTTVMFEQNSQKARKGKAKTKWKKDRRSAASNCRPS